MLSNGTMQDTPALLDVGPHPPRTEARRFWKYLHQWRVVLFQRWKQESRDDIAPAKLGQLVDHLLGTSLLLRYVRSWQGSNVPFLAELCGGDRAVSFLDLCTRIQAPFSCPILRSVFDPSWAPASTSLPIAVFASGWEKRTADALWLLLGDRPVPLTFFGDYHQLCVANPLGIDCSRRYERGIHYTPAPIVDYLVNTILSQAFRGRSIDEIKRLRILDPSCGCGAFVIAALRYVLRWLNDHASGAEHAGDSGVQQRFNVAGWDALRSRY